MRKRESAFVKGEYKANFVHFLSRGLKKRTSEILALENEKLFRKI